MCQPRTAVREPQSCASPQTRTGLGPAAWVQPEAGVGPLTLRTVAVAQSGTGWAVWGVSAGPVWPLEVELGTTPLPQGKGFGPCRRIGGP